MGFWDKSLGVLQLFIDDHLKTQIQVLFFRKNPRAGKLLMINNR
ncbi:hypothetical protein LEP1GSC043_1832 [Leptospira weilii str. Ecochallenge]|uniref:Uncharacterized protein n=1 Tax=Leptospira weilii str. Ecochallenge TaxID=1049986 RepID=N1UCX0_9LEPT|nr:hypothetical protein LEP1GSC043_1832 [Leptospira weilii str. Ecochallenge]